MSGKNERSEKKERWRLEVLINAVESEKNEKEFN
jgi:hypothetical protein